MSPFFSIVVPCCDVESYVRECLASVTGQSFRNWECLIGIEPSKDRTEEVINEITSGDERFRIFHGPRSGSCSASRNTGIDMARGEYVIFLDGDDTIDKESLGRIHDMIAARPGADLYPCALVAYWEGTDKREIRDNYAADSPAEMTGAEATLELDRLWHGGLCPMLQLTVFRREFLMEHDLRCIRGLRNQDSEFSPRALYLAKRVVPLHEPFYIYRIRVNSVQTTPRKAGDFLKDWSIITGSLLKFYGEVSRRADFDPRVARCWCRQWISRMNYKWFSPTAIREIPRERRLETLRTIFADGFDTHRDILKYGSFAQKISGAMIRAFVRHLSMRWISELFFRCYFGVLEVSPNHRNEFRSAIN